MKLQVSSPILINLKKKANIMTITWYKRCLCITELTGIGVELPSSELELNCLRDFVPESELNWNWYYRNWNWNWIAKTELTPTLPWTAAWLHGPLTVTDNSDSHWCLPADYIALPFIGDVGLFGLHYKYSFREHNFNVEIMAAIRFA